MRLMRFLLQCSLVLACMKLRGVNLCPICGAVNTCKFSAEYVVLIMNREKLQEFILATRFLNEY